MKLALATLAALTLCGAAAAQTPPAGDPGMQPQAPYGGPGMGGMHGPPSPEMRAARQAMRQQCAADVARVCPDAQMGGAPDGGTGGPGGGPGGGTGGGRGALGQCLRQHIADVSDGCRTALRNMREMRRDQRDAAPPAAAAPGR